MPGSSMFLIDYLCSKYPETEFGAIQKLVNMTQKYPITLKQVTETLITCSLPNETKEVCAVEIMRYMLENCSQDKGISFEEEFCVSSAKMESIR